jgi:nicotinamidase-related amidase
MTVIYLVDETIAKRYPQHAEIARRAKVFPKVDVFSPYMGWKKERDEQIFDKGWRAEESKKQMNRLRDIAPPIKPTPNDPVAITTAEASMLLRERGIWNILYTGFDAGGCVLSSDGGILAMHELGFRCIVLRDCTTGGETAETAAEETLNKSAVSFMGVAGIAYSADSVRLLNEIKRVTGS